MRWAKKPYIVAIGAGMGGHMHHFKCFFIDLSKHPELCHMIDQTQIITPVAPCIPAISWKNVVKESAVVGKTHQDTAHAYNDLDSLKNQFSDNQLP